MSTRSQTKELRADCITDDYEEVPFSKPPHVKQEVSRGGVSGVEAEAMGAAMQVVVASSPDGGLVGGVWPSSTSAAAPTSDSCRWGFANLHRTGGAPLEGRRAACW